MNIDWLELARSEDLVVALDLDGTLVPYAATPDEAVLDDALLELLGRLVELPRATVGVVSGRPRSMLVELARQVPALAIVGEHGAWRSADGVEEDTLPPSPELDELEVALRTLVARAPGALLERKRCSICLHWRAVSAASRDVLVTAAEARVEEWLETQPDFERLDGAEILEVRHRAAHKGTALAWLRGRAPVRARAVVLGDIGPWACAGMTGGRVYVRVNEEWKLDREAIERRLGEGALVSLSELDAEGELDVQDLLGHYAEELRAGGQDSEADRIAALAAEARHSFLAVIPQKVQADPSVSTE